MATRRKMVAGNWKMHGSRESVAALAEGIKGADKLGSADVVVFPAFVHIPLVAEILSGTNVQWGGQTLHPGAQGAFTGEVSGAMLADYKCRYVLVGHSERRIIFGEDLESVALKFKAALEFGLRPVLCVGETLEQRQNNETENVIAAQLDSVIRVVSIEAFRHAVIAYEPVWAIGTGLTATPEQAQEVHAFIRKQLAKEDVEIANLMRILYGGSVKADNAAGLFAMTDIDGALVGGASLDARSFLAICEVA